MGFWETVGSTVIALAIIGVLGSIATLVVNWTRARLGRRPDFTLDLVKGDWYLRRPRRAIAYEVNYWIGDASNTSVVPTQRVFSQDMTSVESEVIHQLRDTYYFGVGWIDRYGRRAAEVEIQPGVKHYDLVAPRPRRRRLTFK